MTSQKIQKLKLASRPKNVGIKILLLRSLGVRAANLNQPEFSLAFFPSGLGGTGTPGKLRFFYSVNKENYYDIQSNSTTWQKDRWYHIVAIIHPSEGMKMYVDNIKQADTEHYYNATENCQLDTYIGSWRTLPNRYFIGKIDEIIFYNRALT